MPSLRVELTVEPFVEGAPGPHVQAAVDAITRAGLVPEVGPFANSFEGAPSEIAAALTELVTRGMHADATALLLSIRPVRLLSPSAKAHLDAMRPVLRELGALLVEPEQMEAGDHPVRWEGELVAGVRPPDRTADLLEAVPKLIEQAEREFGGRLSELSREAKQQAALWLDERGAFNFRNAADLVAESMGVSRMTVYNYLSAIRSRVGGGT